MMAKNSSHYENLENDELSQFLPCPWCGEFTEEKQNFLAKVTDKHGWKSINCAGCGTNPSFCVYTWEEVVKLWNSRADFSGSNEFQRGVESYKRYLIDVINDREF